MPLPRDYSPRRHWVMTAVMYAVLGATAALAALSSRYPVQPAVDEQLAPNEREIIRHLRTLESPAPRSH